MTPADTTLHRPPPTAPPRQEPPADRRGHGCHGLHRGRLVPELLDAGHTVRAVARHPERLAGRDWSHHVDLVQADAAELDQIRTALQGADVAYYLVHSLGTGSSFASRDRRTALTFARAAREAGVGRIVYLGGLYPDVDDAELSRTWPRARRSGDPPRLGRADDGAPGRGRPRFRIRVVRDDAVPHRTAARDDDAALGRQPHPADRGP
ncbi:NAD(P)H-binding protein [Oerskovia sp. M15]